MRGRLPSEKCARGAQPKRDDAKHRGPRHWKHEIIKNKEDGGDEDELGREPEQERASHAARPVPSLIGITTDLIVYGPRLPCLVAAASPWGPPQLPGSCAGS